VVRTASTWRPPALVGAAHAGRIVFAANLVTSERRGGPLAGRGILPRSGDGAGATVPRGERPAAAVRGSRPSGRDSPCRCAGDGPEIASGTVTIIAMRNGSGLQNKVLEAWPSHAVVTTPQVRRHCSRATAAPAPRRDRGELAAAATVLLRDPARARTMRSRVRAGRPTLYLEASAAAVERAWSMPGCGPACQSNGASRLTPRGGSGIFRSRCTGATRDGGSVGDPGDGSTSVIVGVGTWRRSRFAP